MDALSTRKLRAGIDLTEATKATEDDPGRNGARISVAVMSDYSLALKAYLLKRLK
jgi:hypothetical protein